MRGVLDFECYEWVSPLMCGFAWKNESNEIETEFIFDANASNPEKLGLDTLEYLYSRDDIEEWWAHNGGKYDALFIAQAALARNWEIVGHVAGGSRVIYLGLRPKNSKRWLNIYDTFALVPSRLGHKEEPCKGCCACDFELPSRKSLKADDYETLGSSERVRAKLKGKSGWKQHLIEGCLTDCRLGIELLDKVETLVSNFGGTLKSTFSSSALSTVKAHLSERGMSIPELPSDLNSWSRDGYYGARVEVFNHTPKGTLTEWDVNSSYPWSMTQPMPWEPLGWTNSRKAVMHLFDGTTEGIIKAVVDVPKMDYPPLPFRDEEKGIYFPTGRWQACFPACELRYAMSLGVKVTVVEALAFKPANPFEEFVTSVYQLKATSKGAMRTFSKLLLNGCYGKFGQAPEREVLKVFSTKGDALAYAMERPGKCNHISEDLRFLTEEIFRWPKHTHYPVASYITGYSRVLLHKAMMASKELAYVDTDSIHAVSLQSHVGMGALLGQWKLELEKYRAVFYAPKIYELHPREGNPHFAAKGFPVNEQAFRKLVAKEGVGVSRMQLLKTQLRHDGTVSRVEEEKRWAGRSRKRFPFSNGTTRPWTVEELASGAHLDALSPAA
jgi:hypothetical protein